MNTVKKEEQMDDVIILENNDELIVCEWINLLVDKALEGEVFAQVTLEDIYEMKWEKIKERMLVEGSAWYVWYMDGVHKVMSQALKEREKDD